MIQFLQTAKASTAAVFLYLVGAGFAGIVGYQIITNQAINSIALSFLYGTITYAVNSQGVKAGVDHTNETVSKVAIAQYPMTPNGISAVQEQAGTIAAEQAVQDAKAAAAAAATTTPATGVKP